MTRPELPVTAAKTEHRVQAILALFQEEAVADVCGQYQIGRSDLYKYRHRALTAIRAALTDHPCGPRQPANHLSSRQEAQIVTLCQQHPTWSARAIQAYCGVDAPSLRTLQRVRARHELVHTLKRPPAWRRAIGSPRQSASGSESSWRRNPISAQSGWPGTCGMAMAYG